MTITEPGIYEIPEHEYHADPIPTGSLSNSGAKYLIPPYTPAHYKASLETEFEVTDALRFGRAVHTLLLGQGAPIKVLEFDTWRTKASKEAKEKAETTGHTPLLTHEHEKAVAMVDAIKRNPDAATLLNLEDVKVEQSLFWKDHKTGEWLRCRIDAMGTATTGGKKFLVLIDYKTTAGLAHTGEFGRAAANYGYARQNVWYRAGATALGLDAAMELPTMFLNIVQEKQEPYLTAVTYADVEAERVGREEMRYAIDAYHRCKTADHWPGYEGIRPYNLPTYAIYQHDEKALIS